MPSLLWVTHTCVKMRIWHNCYGNSRQTNGRWMRSHLTRVLAQSIGWKLRWRTGFRDRRNSMCESLKTWCTRKLRSWVRPEYRICLQVGERLGHETAKISRGQSMKSLCILLSSLEWVSQVTEDCWRIEGEWHDLALFWKAFSLRTLSLTPKTWLVSLARYVGRALWENTLSPWRARILTVLTPRLCIKDDTSKTDNVRAWMGVCGWRAPPLSFERDFSMALEIRRKAAFASNVKAFCGWIFCWK